MKFKIGDRVVAVSDVDGWDLKGMKGRIVCFDYLSDCQIGVEFDEFIYSNGVEGHSCGRHGRESCCRYGGFEVFKLLGTNPNSKIIIRDV